MRWKDISCALAESHPRESIAEAVLTYQNPSTTIQFELGGNFEGAIAEIASTFVDQDAENNPYHSSGR